MGGRFRETALEVEQSQRRNFDLRMMFRRRRTQQQQDLPYVRERRQRDHVVKHACQRNVFAQGFERYERVSVTHS